MVDINEKNLKMLYYPDWKEIKKEKWVSSKNFDITTTKFSLIQNPAWKETDILHH